MDIKVYREKQSKEPQTIFLALRQELGGITVTAVNENGNRFSSGSLLRFHTDGTITACTSVNPNLGFDLKPNGSIKTI